MIEKKIDCLIDKKDFKKLLKSLLTHTCIVTARQWQSATDEPSAQPYMWLLAYLRYNIILWLLICIVHGDLL